MFSERKKIIYFTVLASALFVVALFVYLTQPITKLLEIKNKAIVSINGQTLIVDIADTDEKRTRGLMGQRALGINEGMLFVFEGYDKRVFWMKNMNFPIDIIWIADGRVVGVEKNAPPAPAGEIRPTLYTSPVEANRVLEVSAGRSEMLNLSEGDVVQIKTLVPSEAGRLTK